MALPEMRQLWSMTGAHRWLMRLRIVEVICIGELTLASRSHTMVDCGHFSSLYFPEEFWYFLSQLAKLHYPMPP